jgi:hypothetical protein
VRRHLLKVLVVACLMFAADPARAADLTGVVTDETGGALPGVTVTLRATAGDARSTVTDETGRYRFDGVPAGEGELTFALFQFATARRAAVWPATGEVRVDAVLQLSLSAEVLVTGRRTFTNLADLPNPAENIVGVAQSASQGAITSAQLEARPMTRAGEVLETVPGVIISQHSGEGKANQYYLRGFNLDHGTDFATTVAGMPVNMPTHGHGHGYSDLSFLIPELVSGVQYSKGPYFAEQGDFATAGSANINYVNILDRPLVFVGGGQDGYGRALAAVSPRVGAGHLLAAFEAGHNDGPWDRPDSYRKFNGLVRFSRGDSLNGFVVTGMGYQADWDSTDQVPTRAIESGLIGRFGNLDPSDGGDSYRYSGSVEWQRASPNQTTRIAAFGIGYGLDLFSNFTFLLDDPERGDQFEQGDRRFVAGVKASYGRMTLWGDRLMRNTVGVQVRNDAISRVGLYHTEARARLETTREDEVLQTSGAAYLQNEVEWTPTLRTLAGVRVDAYRFDVDADNPANSGVETDVLASSKGGVVIGPFRGTEFYVNGGFGFHSNDARGATITIDPKTGDPADRVTPLARAVGTEFGVRTVAIRGLQSSLAVWTLHLDSELIFIGDAGSTEAGRPSHRFGIEWSSYARPKPWLVLDGDLAWTRAHFTDDDPSGERIPGAPEYIIAAGVTVDDINKAFGSLRWRFFGPRPLIEDNSVRSESTSLVNLEGGYKITPAMRLVVDVFNLFDAEDSDIDYFYESRLPGEPDEGITDVHLHPTIPRTFRIGLGVTF